MKKFITDTLFISVGGLLSKAKGILFLPLIIGAVGLSNYGAFVQIYANVKILIPFCTLGLGMGFQRFASVIESQNKQELSTHFYSILIPTLFFGLCGVVLLFSISPFLSDWFLNGEYLASLQISCFMVLSNSCYTNINKFLLAVKKFKLYSVLEFLYAFIPYLGFVIGCLLYGDIFHGILLYTAFDGFIALVFFIIIVKDLKLVFPSKEIFKQYFQFSYPLAISNIEGGLLNKADRYFISYFWGTESLGIYNIIHRISDLISFVSVPIRKQIMSYLPKIWDEGYKQESINIIKSSLLVFGLISIGILGYLIFYFQDLLLFLIDKKVEVDNIEFLVALLGMASIISGTKVFYYILMRLNKKTKNELFFQLVGLFFNITLNFILVPILGLLGCALATFTSYFLIIYLINSRYKLDLDIKFFLHILSFFVFAIVFWGTNQLINPSNLFFFILSSIIGFLGYSILVFLTKRQLLIGIKSEIELYRKIMKGKKKRKAQV